MSVSLHRDVDEFEDVEIEPALALGQERMAFDCGFKAVCLDDAVTLQFDGLDGGAIVADGCAVTEWGAAVEPRVLTVPGDLSRPPGSS